MRMLKEIACISAVCLILVAVLWSLPAFVLQVRTEEAQSAMARQAELEKDRGPSRIVVRVRSKNGAHWEPERTIGMVEYYQIPEWCREDFGGRAEAWAAYDNEFNSLGSYGTREEAVRWVVLASQRVEE